METISKAELIDKLRQIREMGWIESLRPGNQGGVGNTLEVLLGIPENNLPIPNAAEWELKTQALGMGRRQNSLTTLFHFEPSPRTLSLVSNLLLPMYGWSHQEAGIRYSAGEMSFRQTINALNRTDRGFGVRVDHVERKVEISFDSQAVHPRHKAWLGAVGARVGLGELSPQPYWGFDDLFHKAGTKLINCFYVEAEKKKIKGVEYFAYGRIFMLERFSLDAFIKQLENGVILVDFDARTGHNHGTKFRMRPGELVNLYESTTEI